MQRDGTWLWASYDQRFESRHGKTCPDEPHRVWQTHAPGDNRDDNSCAEEG
jgi:hypothetical protein